MRKSIVSIGKYEKPFESVKKVIELANGLENLPSKAKVFIKPNLVYWNRHCTIPKWGVLTTSRVMEDVVALLKEKGIEDIIIGEGIVKENPKDKETAADAWERLGYNKLIDKYGVKVYDLFDRPYEKIDLNTGFKTNFSSDALNADFLIDIPTLKTHAQAMVSLGLKNLKGLISVPSRKKFHNADPVKNLHHNVAQLANKIPPSLTIIDGIYSLERGPAIDGKSHRKNILVASSDILSADMVGAKLLGIDPSTVPYIIQAAKDRNRPTDLSDVEVIGEKIENMASHHEWDFKYNDAGDLPLPFQRAGIKGIKYHKYDSTMCTYCSGVNGLILIAIKMAYRKSKPFDKVEVLSGKVMRPTPGNNKTILFGQCQYNLNKDHPEIKELISIPGCPPAKEDIRDALEKIGLKVPKSFWENLDKAPGWLMQKYKGKPEFEESFFQVQ
ncbi:MAG: DUF362 domain-containing protein [Promethearchaeota archaeon]|nr:MAG: DUF362 domain-containing protein [Candidatus Lokiarchaeota archaeon]